MLTAVNFIFWEPNRCRAQKLLKRNGRLFRRRAGRFNFPFDSRCRRHHARLALRRNAWPSAARLQTYSELGPAAASGTVRAYSPYLSLLPQAGCEPRLPRDDRFKAQHRGSGQLANGKPELICGKARGGQSCNPLGLHLLSRRFPPPKHRQLTNEQRPRNGRAIETRSIIRPPQHVMGTRALWLPERKSGKAASVQTAGMAFRRSASGEGQGTSTSPPRHAHLSLSPKRTDITLLAHFASASGPSPSDRG